ncbi:MAG: TraB/GumN family protein [Bacteroidia bacterium]
MDIRACFVIITSLVITNCYGQATLLWKIECDSCPKTSYLMGTNHGFDGDYLFKHQQLAAIAYSVDAIADEADRSVLKDKLIHDDSLIAGVSLRDLVDSADYELVAKKFQSVYYVPFSMVEKYYPHAIQQGIYFGQAGNYNTEYHKTHPDDTTYHRFMDYMIQDIAIERKIPLYGLETRDEIYKMQYRDMPLKEQAKMLVNTLKTNPDDIRYKMADTCFTDQSLDCLCSVVPGVSTYSRPGDSTLIYKRNLLWMEKIPALLHKQSLLIAVGAMHLCGNYGLVDLLIRKKYKLTPLLYK